MAKVVTQEMWLGRAVAKHGDRYDYSKVRYSGANAKVEIICRAHGSFFQDASSHTAGHGCPICKAEKIGNVKRASFDDLVARAQIIHDNKYVYPQQPYKNVSTKIKIVCPEHGEFEQTMSGHLAGKGCDQCGGKMKLSLEEMLRRFRLTHGETYDYSKVEEVWASEKVEIVCPKHGSFWQVAQDHWSGHGCRACSVGLSAPEIEMKDWLESLGVVVVQGDRTVIAPKEIDIWLPEHNVGIEHHGLHWHTEDKVGNLHAEKRVLAEKAGVRLIQIYEDEWFNRNGAVKQVIMNAIGLAGRRVGARQCRVADINKSMAIQFFEANHVQGAGPSTMNFGLFFGDELVAVMAFNKATSGRGKYGEGVYELSRYATSCSVQGGATKLLAHFDKLHSRPKLVSYVDHRYFVGGMYQKLGFEKVRTAVDYEYLYRRERRHKSSFQKCNLVKLLGDRYNPALTERVLTEMLGAKRLLNAGRTTWMRT